MLDIKSKIVLKILNKECPNGAFKIVDSSDIISSMPNKYKVDFEGLKHILIYLERQDCISIRYDDDSVYCLAVLPYGYELCETAQQKEKLPKRKLPLYVIYIIIFTLCFLGGLIGSLIANLINLP